MTEHTPGPWRLSVPDETLVVAGENRAVATTFQDEGDYIDQCDRRYADACLISAAPELLEALKKMIAWGIEPDADSKSVREARLADVWAKARSAIAKAEGGDA